MFLLLTVDFFFIKKICSGKAITNCEGKNVKSLMTKTSVFLKTSNLMTYTTKIDPSSRSEDFYFFVI